MMEEGVPRVSLSVPGGERSSNLGPKRPWASLRRLSALWGMPSYDDGPVQYYSEAREGS